MSISTHSHQEVLDIFDLIEDSEILGTRSDDFSPDSIGMAYINEYEPSHTLLPTLDLPNISDFAIFVSFGANCVVDFTKAKSEERVQLLIKPRSLYLMTVKTNAPPLSLSLCSISFIFLEGGGEDAMGTQL